MDRIPFLNTIKAPMMVGMTILFVLIILMGCTAGNDKNPKDVLGTVSVGETVWVCGCPMMCCNTISRNPGRCACNVPLRQGTVSTVRDGKVYVNVSGREKVLLVTGRQ